MRHCQTRNRLGWSTTNAPSGSRRGTADPTDAPADHARARAERARRQRSAVPGPVRHHRPGMGGDRVLHPRPTTGTPYLPAAQLKFASRRDAVMPGVTVTSPIRPSLCRPDRRFRSASTMVPSTADRTAVNTRSILRSRLRDSRTGAQPNTDEGFSRQLRTPDATRSPRNQRTRPMAIRPTVHSPATAGSIDLHPIAHAEVAPLRDAHSQVFIRVGGADSRPSGCG